MCMILHRGRPLTVTDKGHDQCSQGSNRGSAVLVWLRLKDDYDSVKICIMERVTLTRFILSWSCMTAEWQSFMVDMIFSGTVAMP